MRTRMDDTVHIEVKVILLLANRVGAGDVQRDFLAVHLLGLLLNNRRNNLRIFVGEPSEKRRDTHIGDATLLESRRG